MPTVSRRRPYAPRMPRSERRAQLLDAALKVIGREGYGGVTIEAIAREAGVTRPVVYNLFDDLAELLGALLERQEQRALAQLSAAMPKREQPNDPGAPVSGPAGRRAGGTPENGPRAHPDRMIVDGLLAFLSAVAGDPDSWRAILLPPEGTPKVVRDRVARNRSAMLEELQALAAGELQRRGGPKGMDTELLARSILVAAEEAGRLVLSDRQRFTPERVAGFANMLLGGLGRG